MRLARGRPTFQWIEAQTWKCPQAGLRVTPPTVRLESWLSVIGGARGIGFFPADWDPALTPAIAAIAKEVAALGGALLAPGASGVGVGTRARLGPFARRSALRDRRQPDSQVCQPLDSGCRPERQDTGGARGGEDGRVLGRFVRGRLRAVRRPPVCRQAFRLEGLRDDAQVAHERAQRRAARLLVALAEDRRGVNRGDDVLGERRVDRLAALPGHAEVPAEKRLRRGRPERDDHSGPDGGQFRLQPGPAGDRLRPGRLLVDPPLARPCHLKCLTALVT